MHSEMPPTETPGAMRKDTDSTNTPEDSSAAGQQNPIRKFADRVPFGLATIGTAGVLAAATVTAAFAAPLSSSGGAEPEDGPSEVVAAQAESGQDRSGQDSSGGNGEPAQPQPNPAQAAQEQRANIVNGARAELGTKEEGGEDCTKYSTQCVSWCALFAMDIWDQAGVDVNNEEYAFTGDVYTTGEEHGTAYDSDQLQEAKPGDVLLFGTDPSSPDTSSHIGIVENVEGDTVTLIEGNSGDNTDEVVRKDHQLSEDTFYGGVAPW